MEHKSYTSMQYYYLSPAISIQAYNKDIYIRENNERRNKRASEEKGNNGQVLNQLSSLFPIAGVPCQPTHVRDDRSLDYASKTSKPLVLTFTTTCECGHRDSETARLAAASRPSSC
jgi:hypothetical protein